MPKDNQPFEFLGDGQERMAYQQSQTSQTSSGNHYMAPSQLDERLNVPTMYSGPTTSRQAVDPGSTTSNHPRVFTGDLNSQPHNQVPPSNNQPEMRMVFKVYFPTRFIVNGVDKATRAKLLKKQIIHLINREVKVYQASHNRNEYLASMGFVSQRSTIDQYQEAFVPSQISNGYFFINDHDQQHIIQESPSSMPNGGPMHQPMMQPGHPQGMNNMANNYQVGNTMMTGSINSPQTMNYQQQPQGHNANMYAQQQQPQQFQSHRMHSQSTSDIMFGQPGQYGNQQSSPYDQQDMHQQHMSQQSLMQQQTPPQQHLITSSSSPSLMSNAGAQQQQHGNNFNVPQQQQPIQQHQQGNLMINNSNPITTSSPTPMSSFINSNPMQQQGGQSLIDSPGKANIIHMQQQPQQAPGGMNMMNTRPQQIAPSPSPSAVSMQPNMNVAGGNFSQNPRMINPGSNAAYQMSNDMNSGNMAGNAVNSNNAGGYIANGNLIPTYQNAVLGVDMQITPWPQQIADERQEPQQQQQDNQAQAQLHQHPAQQNIQDVSNQDQQEAFGATIGLPFELDSSVEGIDFSELCDPFYPN